MQIGVGVEAAAPIRPQRRDPLDAAGANDVFRVRREEDNVIGIVAEDRL